MVPSFEKPLNLPTLETTVLTTDRLVIRPPEDGHIDPLFAAVQESLAEIRPWLAWYYPGYSWDDTALWINNVPVAWREDREYSFVILDRENGELLGTIGINQLDRRNRRANLGYFVRTSATTAALPLPQPSWSRGLASSKSDSNGSKSSPPSAMSPAKKSPTKSVPRARGSPAAVRMSAASNSTQSCSHSWPKNSNAGCSAPVVKRFFVAIDNFFLACRLPT